MPEIGATLREARMRERIDVSEIEAQTKIRAKYLRALENEEWGLLPGPTFVKSFLRTYAQALGLDGKALVEEYRLHHERPSEGMLEPIVSNRNRGRSRPSRPGRDRDPGPSRGYTIAVGTILVIIVVLIVLLVTNGSSKKKETKTTATTPVTATKHAAKPRHATTTKAGTDVVSLSITPTAAVYVCLIGEGGRKLIGGEELQAGQSTSTYHAKHFELTLGNNSVTLYIDGRARTVPASSSAIGYSITKARGRRTLPASQQPTCK
ncbi:MAG TPA: helix-turn-helix domain-containing protein [Solirubrobacteraceae bacterium]|nr:helix-turn-helix domain-containing protein [Solirubrobacteraceae bacterium]